MKVTTPRHCACLQRHKARDLGERKRERLDQNRRMRGRLAVQRASEWGQEHEYQHHDKVLDNQPAHCDAPALGLDQAPLLQQAQ